MSGPVSSPFHMVSIDAIAGKGNPLREDVWPWLDLCSCEAPGNSSLLGLHQESVSLSELVYHVDNLNETPFAGKKHVQSTVTPNNSPSLKPQ